MEIHDDLVEDFESNQKMPKRRRPPPKQDVSNIDTTLNVISNSNDNIINNDTGININTNSKININNNNPNINNTNINTNNNNIININTNTNNNNNNNNDQLPKRNKKILNPVILPGTGLPSRKPKNIALDINTNINTNNNLPYNNNFRNNDIINNNSNMISNNNILNRDILDNNIINNDNDEDAFYFNVQGMIKNGIFFEGNAIFIKYDICFGESWEIVSGQKTGLTQHACEGEGISNFFVWNMPFEISLKSNEPSGWPQLLLSLYTPDDLGREVIKGYGICYFPTVNGKHKRKMHIFSPISSELFSGINEAFFGEKPELFNPKKVLMSGEGREILKTQSEGEIDVVFNVQINGIEDFGYEIN